MIDAKQLQATIERIARAPITWLTNMVLWLVWIGCVIIAAYGVFSHVNIATVYPFIRVTGGTLDLLYVVATAAALAYVPKG